MTKKEKDDKRGKKRGRVENLTPFTKDNQPSPEAKSKGRERKREAKRIMDKIMELGDMTQEELKAYIKENKDKITIKEQIRMKHVQDLIKSPKARQDRLDRHVSKAPLKQEFSGSIDTTPTSINIFSKSDKEKEGKEEEKE